ncbi:hypothetical protein K7X08_037566 [Anisodus acutangulus]|uniref:Uncharacterized protein n=1 Tax=Anisodus acutangulus TaxID=402998 RepID=A0A9Q1MWS2_9SOLA|nr:hypothetical protein K7X08_037566 [Anisodus acutangulus]
MTRPIIIRSPPSVLSLDKRQPLLLSTNDSSSSRGGGSVVWKARFAEVAGGTTAECTAVACCCPCGIVNLLVLAVYKVPAGLCRKALRKNRRNRKCGISFMVLGFGEAPLNEVKCNAVG